MAAVASRPSSIPGSSSHSRLAAAAFSLFAHLALFALVLYSVKPDLRAPPAAEPALVVPVEIVPPPPKTPVTPEPVKNPEPAPAKSTPKEAPRKALARPTPAPARVAALPAGPVQGSDNGVSDSELAGAAIAGAGAGRANCDMAARLRDALRKDSLVRAAAAKAGANGNHAIRVWNGDWVQSGGDDGKGLQAAREAILWEVGFAPPACREQAVRGLVVITMNDAPSSAKLVLGAALWRWSDLLGRR
ncbi:MAG TPA: hypothetical protein VGF71_17525 [Caulobacteraceae bacterium]|jgi:hypothetical protein